MTPFARLMLVRLCVATLSAIAAYMAVQGLLQHRLDLPSALVLSIAALCCLGMWRRASARYRDAELADLARSGQQLQQARHLLGASASPDTRSGHLRMIRGGKQ
jgi:hypothetical protein